MQYNNDFILLTEHFYQSDADSGSVSDCKLLLASAAASVISALVLFMYCLISGLLEHTEDCIHKLTAGMGSYSSISKVQFSTII